MSVRQEWCSTSSPGRRYSCCSRITGKRTEVGPVTEDDSTIPIWGFDSPARWETAVATVEQVSARKKLDLSQGWYHHGNRFELEYLVASYLLGKRSNSALFQPCPIDSPHLPEGSPYDLSCYAADVYAAELEAYPEIFDVELGPPMGVRYPVEEHLWAREFQRGRVYVNASLTESGWSTWARPCGTWTTAQ